MVRKNRNNFYKPQLSLTFDDISLMPVEESDIPTRRDESISLHSQISRNITVKIPVIASYMDTVCRSKMAIALGRIGSLGIIDRLLSVHEQVREVQIVKRSESKVIRDPYTIHPSATVGEIKAKLKEKKVGAFLVVSDNHELLGVVSTRDVDLREGNDLTVEDVMTKRERLIVGGPEITTDEAIKLFTEHRIEKAPLVDKHNRVVGLVSKKDILKLKNELALRDKEGRLAVGASIGVPPLKDGKPQFDVILKHVEALLSADTDLIVLAIANGYLKTCRQTVEILRSTFSDIDLAAGVVTEYEGAKRLFIAGADTVLVGIGPGSICETRQVAGVGVPLFTALRLAQKAAREEGKSILSDGGVHKPHDFVKALFAGASGTILGSALAGTDESPTEITRVNGQLVKFQRGLASDDAKIKFQSVGEGVREVDPEDLIEYVYRHVGAEGVESGLVPYTGKAVEAVREIISGIRSAMTYMGVRTIPELWEACDKGYYVRVTDAGLSEGKPHDLLTFRS